MEVLAAGALPTVAAVGGSIVNYSYTVVYEPFANGACVNTR